MSVYTPLDEDDAQFADLVSVELFAGIGTNLNYLIDSVSPGSVIMVLHGLTGVPEPDPEFFQLCDGSAITNPRSPLRGSNTPDALTLGLYMKGYDSIGNVGVIAGSHTKNLQHDHGGTGLVNYDAEQYKTDSDNDQFNSVPHVHTMSNDLGTAVNFEPPHVRIKHYLKIR